MGGGWATAPDSLSPPAFCQVLVDTMENRPGLRYIWSTFKPLLQGKVLYTPDTPAARRLIKEVKSRQEMCSVFRVGQELLWDSVSRVPAKGNQDNSGIPGCASSPAYSRLFLTAVFRPGQRHLRRPGAPPGAGGPVGRARATRLGLPPGQPSSQHAPGEPVGTVAISKEFPPTFSHFSPVEPNKNEKESGIKAPGGNV